jgi:Fic family protein
MSNPSQADIAATRMRFLTLSRRVGQPTGLDYSLPFPEPVHLTAALDQLTELKACIDSFRPFDAAQMRNLRENWDIEYTWASNRIEGNTLSLLETRMVIHDGMTIAGKRLIEHLEAINHHEAIAEIRDMATSNDPMMERDIEALHGLVLHGIDREDAGRYRTVQVGIRGTSIVFPHPIKVPELMAEYFAFYDAVGTRMHPVALAAAMHQKLVDIHPFVDGNGRTSRLVMNLLLLKAGYPITIIPADEPTRRAYFDALNAAREGLDGDMFTRFVIANVKYWCIRTLDMMANNIGDDAADKGAPFFAKIAPYLPST